MTDARGKHIAGDDEFLERFVLGALPESERRAAEEHCAECHSCAAAVRRERLIAAGARRLGRDHLKAVLRQSARDTPERPVMWPRLLSAAAILGLIVGAGLYYDWLGGGNILEGPEELTQRGTPDAGLNAETPPAVAPAPGRDEPGLADARTKSGRYAEGAPSAAAEKKGDRADTPAPYKAEGDLAAKQPAAAGATAGIAEESGAKGKETEATAVVFWTEGTPLSGAEEVGAAQAADKISIESQLRTMKKELEAKTKSAIKFGTANERRSTAANFLVNQAPANTLPRARQVYQRSNAGGVQTLVTQEGNVTTMTLYLDSLVDADEANAASVEPVAGDSVIVNLGKQRIGYRFPQESGKQQAKPVK